MKKNELNFLFHLMKRVEDGGAVVELGSFLGNGSSRMFARGIKHYRKKATLYCVDEFKDEFFSEPRQSKGFADKFLRVTGGRKIIDVFRENMKPYRHVEVSKESEMAALGFADGSVDLVFIDADHTYEAVKRDLRLWYPKVKTGGILCGHDYGKSQFGVAKAVDELFGKPMTVVNSIWVIKKGQE